MVAIVAAGHEIFDDGWAASFAAHCCDNDVATNDDFGDDGNCFGSIDSESESSTDYCCSPKSLAEIDLASSEGDDVS